VRAWFPALILSVIIAGCGPRDDHNPGRIDVRWTGADSGRLTFPGTAHWCAQDTTLEIIAQRGDSGVGLVIFPADSLKTGSSPVTLPTDSMSRPRSGLALRWFGETLITGFYSQAGATTVTSIRPLAGSIQASLKSVVDGRTIEVRGTFSGFTVVPFCQARTPPDSSIR
jgi:hypothetical protein